MGDYAKIVDSFIVKALKSSTKGGVVNRAAAKTFLKSTAQDSVETTKALQKSPVKLSGAFITRLNKLTMNKTQQFFENMASINKKYDFDKIPASRKIYEILEKFNATPRGKIIKSKNQRYFEYFTKTLY